MNSLNTWLLIAVGAAALTLVVHAATKGKVDTTAAKEKIKQGALVVDVRTPAEYATGHYDGATNIPLAEVANRLADFGPKDKPIVVYCRSGNRSGMALRILQEAGYTNVTNAGGLTDLQK